MTSIDTPALKRRLICMIYEAMLLFAVAFLATFIFSLLTQAHHEPYLRYALQAWLFVAAGAYFVWLWSRGGQTLAMKTWRIKLVMADDGRPLTIRSAVGRYLFAWFWFLPGLIVAWLLGTHGSMLILIPLLNLVLWACTAYLSPDRQFLHDRLMGTKLINVPKNRAKVSA